jgi:hypothetical protein
LKIAGLQIADCLHLFGCHAERSEASPGTVTIRTVRNFSRNDPQLRFVVSSAGMLRSTTPADEKHVCRVPVELSMTFNKVYTNYASAG